MTKSTEKDLKNEPNNSLKGDSMDEKLTNGQELPVKDGIEQRDGFLLAAIKVISEINCLLFDVCQQFGTDLINSGGSEY